MTNGEIQAVLEREYAHWRIQPHVEPPVMQWCFHVDVIPGWIQTHVEEDRVEVVGVVHRQQDVDRADLVSLLKVNYHWRLHSRYAMTNDGKLVVAFIHSLTDLTPRRLTSAMDEVVTCVGMCRAIMARK